MTRGAANRQRVRWLLATAVTVFMAVVLLTLINTFNTTALQRSQLIRIVNTEAAIEQCIGNSKPLECVADYRKLYTYTDNAPSAHVNLVYAIEELLDWEAVRTGNVSLIREYMVSKSLLQHNVNTLVRFSVDNDPDGSAYVAALTAQYRLAKERANGR